MLNRMLSLEEDDYEIHLAKDAEEGLAIAIKNNSISLLIADFNLRTVSLMFSFHTSDHLVISQFSNPFL